MPLNTEERRLRLEERARERAEAAEREERIQAVLALNLDPTRDFVKAFDGTPFADIHKRVRKIGRRSDAWPALHRLLVHRDRWARPLEEWEPRGKAVESVLRSLVTHLVCRYPMPSFWYEIWFRCAQHRGAGEPFADFDNYARSIDNFVRLAQGEGLHRLVQEGAFSIPFTRRQCHAFMGQRNANTLPHAVRWTQVESFGGTRRLADVLCGTSWGDDLDCPPATEEFRTAAIQWFCNQAMLDPVQVGPLVDYMEHCRLQNPHWSLKGRTGRSLLRDMEEWHVRLAEEGRVERRAEEAERRKPPPEKFEPSGIEGYYWHRHVKAPRTGKQIQEVWRIVELLTLATLGDEGRELRHCVVSYAWSIGRGSKSMWSLSCQNEKCLTLEVHNPTKTVRHARGYGNRLPLAREVDVVRRWAAKADLQVAKRAVAGW